jgi:hypothetical protein
MSLMSYLADAPHSAPVTHVGDLIGWVIGILLVIALVYWLMRQGWNWRKTVQSGLPEPTAVPTRTTEAILETEGRYAGTTTAGNWLDRVAAHHLGDRSLVELTLSAEGLKVVRPASQSFFIPVGDLRGARLDKGIAGKVFPEGGLLVVTWKLGDTELDSGFRADRSGDQDNWVTAIEVLIKAHGKVTHANENDKHTNVEGA